MQHHPVRAFPGLLLAFSFAVGCSAPTEPAPTELAPEEPELEPELDHVAAAPEEPVEEALPPAVEEEVVPETRQLISDEDLAAYGLPYDMIEGEPMFTLLERDGIPAIDDPSFVSVDDALDWMDMDETVLGVVGKDGTAKCYSAWQLDSHEIVNDVLDGEPIAATW